MAAPVASTEPLGGPAHRKPQHERLAGTLTPDGQAWPPGGLGRGLTSSSRRLVRDRWWTDTTRCASIEFRCVQPRRDQPRATEHVERDAGALGGMRPTCFRLTGSGSRSILTDLGVVLRLARELSRVQTHARDQVRAPSASAGVRQWVCLTNCATTTTNMRGHQGTFTDCFVLSGELLSAYAVGARQILIQPLRLSAGRPGRPGSRCLRVTAN